MLNTLRSNKTYAHKIFYLAELCVYYQHLLISLMKKLKFVILSLLIELLAIFKLPCAK